MWNISIVQREYLIWQNQIGNLFLKNKEHITVTLANYFKLHCSVEENKSHQITSFLLSKHARNNSKSHNKGEMTKES